MRNTKQAFLWITNILEENNIKYKISGGFAARIYGSKRRLADIDVEVLKKDIKKIYKIVNDFVIYKPQQYKDENWDLTLMTIKYKNQEIDIASFEAKIFNKILKKWIIRPGEFEDVNKINIYGVNVPVEKKNSLINYKKMLARDVDIKDVRKLSS